MCGLKLLLVFWEVGGRGGGGMDRQPCVSEEERSAIEAPCHLLISYDCGYCTGENV